MQKQLRGWVGGVFLLAVLAAAVQAEDNPNWGQDIIRPIEKSAVHHQENVNFGKYNFAAGPADAGAIKAVTPLEGKVSAILYQAAANNSAFEIYSVYKKYLADNGFEILFAGEKGACGGKFNQHWYDLNPFARDTGWNNSAPIKNGSADDLYYLAAKKKHPEGDLYVAMLANSGWWQAPAYKLDVVQVKPLETKVVPASRIGEALATEGHLAFYGITFDSGRSEMKPESEATVAELAAYLKQAAGESFYVVGHTDDVGALADNLKLSEARAKTVAAVLIQKHGVAAGMLEAHGVGPLAPVGPNDTEAGRAKNRRVEVAKRVIAAPAGGGKQKDAAAKQQGDLQKQKEAEAKRQAMLQKQKEAEKQRQEMMDRIKQNLPK